MSDSDSGAGDSGSDSGAGDSEVSCRFVQRAMTSLDMYLCICVCRSVSLSLLSGR